MAQVVSFDVVWSEIKKAYNPAFLQALMDLPGAHVYAFGGIITDLSLGKPWKDLDVRVIWDVPREVQERDVAHALEPYVHIEQKFSFVDGVVFRIKETDGKDMIIDIGVANNFNVFISDFTACALFMDLKTGSITEMYKNGLHDLEQELVRMDPKAYSELEKYPFYPLRALKLATKGSFKIDPEFGEFLKTKDAYVRRATNDLIAYLHENGKDSIGEFYTGNIFGGFKSNPARYVSLLEEYGYLRDICEVLHAQFGSQGKQIVLGEKNFERFKTSLSLEESLSLFLSIIAEAISDTPAECFTTLAHAFAFDTNRADGNEFVVKPTEIIFIPSSPR